MRHSDKAYFSKSYFKNLEKLETAIKSLICFCLAYMSHIYRPVVYYGVQRTISLLFIVILSTMINCQILLHRCF